MKDYVAYYFPKGCPECKGKIKFQVSTYVYECEDCKRFASAHRKNTDNSLKYEPYQYLATKEINDKRKLLRETFDQLWHTRITIIHDVKDILTPVHEALINIIYTENVRRFEGVEPPYVIVRNGNKEEGTCDVETLNQETIKNLNYRDLKFVRNRDKAFVWLSKQLGITFEQCRVGYLDEQQLEKAIEICNENVNRAKKRGLGTDKDGS